MTYENWGNEKLKPLAVEGDKQAVEELARRGNTLTEEGRLQKVIVTKNRNRNAKGELISEDVTERTIEDGQLVKLVINGTDRPIPTIGFNG